MTRISSQTRPTKQLKTKATQPNTKQTLIIKTTKTKDKWEMSAREALLVDFVVSEI
ncbi:MAG: hypothetical protein ACJAWS_001365 [Oleiphilaceae bacterium]|jgi:hypothetical protein